MTPIGRMDIHHSSEPEADQSENFRIEIINGFGKGLFFEGNYEVKLEAK